MGGVATQRAIALSRSSYRRHLPGHCARWPVAFVPFPTARCSRPNPIYRDPPQSPLAYFQNAFPIHFAASKELFEGEIELLGEKIIMYNPGSNSSTSSSKRKKSGPGFYAVRVGHKPGVYMSWSDTQQQVSGYSGAVFEKFKTLTEAEAFMKGSNSPTSTPGSGSGKRKFYGVAAGHTPGVYTDWPSTQAQIRGFSGAKQKGFSTREEAEIWVQANSRYTSANYSTSSAPISLRGDLDSEASTALAKGCKVGDASISKMQQTNDGSAVATAINGDANVEPGMGLLPPDAEDGFDRTIKLDPKTGTLQYKTNEELNAVKRQPAGDFTGPLEIWTDGACLGNGKAGSVAGVGVYFGPKDNRNVSSPLPGDRQTNQRAELTAIQRALDIAPSDRKVVIHTDSNYSLKCCTEWFQNWRRNGWRSAAKKPVENRDLIEAIVDAIELRERHLGKGCVRLNWVKGHATDVGNNAADALASLAAREALSKSIGIFGGGEIIEEDELGGGATPTTSTTTAAAAAKPPRPSDGVWNEITDEAWRRELDAAAAEFGNSESGVKDEYD